MPFQNSSPGRGRSLRLPGLAAEIFPFHECHLVGPVPIPSVCAAGDASRNATQVLRIGNIGRNETQPRFLTIINAAINMKNRTTST